MRVCCCSFAWMKCAEYVIADIAMKIVERETMESNKRNGKRNVKNKSSMNIEITDCRY